jgi:hypothetical protein
VIGAVRQRGGEVYVLCSIALCLGIYPLLARWNELAGTPMEAPLDGLIPTSAYRRYKQNKHLQRTSRDIVTSYRWCIIYPNTWLCLPFGLIPISKQGM